MRAALLLLLMSAGATKVLAQVGTDFWSDDLHYQITSVNPPQVQLLGGQNVSGHLIIPSAVSYSNEDYNVIAIDNNDINHGAFENCTSLTKVTFPSTMQSIEDYAFTSCTYLAEVDFSACTNLTNLGASAFAYNRELTSVSLPGSLTEIKNAEFNGCSSLASVDIPNGVNTIGISAFKQTALTTITLPASVSSIGENAFQQCNNLATINAYRTTPPVLATGTFPGSAEQIITVYVPNGSTTAYQSNHGSGNQQGWGDYTNFTFQDLPANTLLYRYDEVNHTATLTGYVGEVSGVLEIPSSVTKNNVDYTVTAVANNAFMGCNGLTGVTFPATLTSLGQYAFRECTSITSVVIPSTLTDIGDGAFLWCLSLREVSLPDNMTRIGKGMFEGAAFTEIQLPSSLQGIDMLAFYGTGLTSLTFPASVTHIEEMAFKDCLDLEYVVALPTTPPSIHSNSFEDIDPIPLYMPEESYDVYAFAWGHVDNLNISNRPGLIYNTESNTATVSGCSPNYVGDLVIPSTFGNKTVVGIEANALQNQPYITSVSIPSSVTSIGNRAFTNCQSLSTFTVDASNNDFTTIDGVLFNKAGTELVAYPAGKAGTSYSVPSGVTKIWDYAFDGSNLTSIALPASVTTLGKYNVAHNAFQGASKLTTITVDANNANYQAVGGLLFNKAGTELMVCPEGVSGTYTVPAGVTVIDRYAFYQCKKLTSIILNDGVQTLADAAFNTCTGLTSMVIPSTVTAIEAGTFNNCANLQVLTCYCTTFPAPSSNPFIIGVNPELIIYVRTDLLSTYQASSYWNIFDLQAITTPDANIQYSYNDTNFTATVTGLYDATATGPLTIPVTVIKPNTTTPYTVTAIADEAFKDNTGLTSVYIAHTVETIGEYAFSGCTGMTDLTIGRNVKTIGAYAFGDCIGLTAIHYYATNCETVSDLAWIIGYDLTTIADKTLDIKNCVQTIPACCFYALFGLRNVTVTIPNSVTSIGDWAFRYSDLAGISIGSGLKTIGRYAFYESSLQSVDLPSNVTEIGVYAFKDCENLTSATVWGAKRISVGMFKGCTALTSFDVKSTTRRIHSYAFSGCTALTTLTTAGYGGNLISIGEEAFSGCTALTAVDIPNTVTTIYGYAFNDCSSMTTLTIGTGVESIGDGAFYYCSGLTSINYNATHCNSVGSSVWTGVGNNAKTLNIGSNVEVIPVRAFENLRGFTTVALPNALTLIKSTAFKGCNLTEITIPNSVTEIESDAFMSCNLNTIVLGSGLANIGTYAFAGNNNIVTITSYNTTPPAVTQNVFSNYNATLKVLAPAMTAYTNHAVWSLFTNTQSLEGYYFTGATDSNWGTATNWSTGEVPTTDCIASWQPDPTTVNVIIMADATVNIDNAFAYDLTIMDGSVVTIPANKKLQIGYDNNSSFTSSGASALVVEEGGQLWNNIDVQATVEKGITGYTSSSNGWRFVAAPIGEFYSYEADWLDPTNVANMVNGTFDLYRFDQTQYQAEWQNYKAHSFNLRNGWGYLYANANDVTLEFAGTVKSNEYPREVSLEYTTETIEVPMDPENPDAGYNYENYPLAGWNLVGNPFACDAYLGGSNYQSYNYYKMNSMGSGIEAVENVGDPIPACTGIFVNASFEGTVSFLRASDPNMISSPNNGSLQIALEQANVRGASEKIDNAIVSFNEGSKLEKFVLFEDNARIYIPQNGKDYAIVSSEGSGEMPINFKAVDNGKYTITVNPSNVEMAYLHLIDNLTGADTDLLQTSSYTFNGGQSDYASRFRLVFATSAEGDETFAYYNGSEWVISNESRATLQLVDVLGHVLRSETIDGNASFSTNGLGSGVYVMRLIDGENVRTQKIVVR